jgi:protein-L-isoaspartate O-methyltransferase
VGELAAAAREALEELGVTNVEVVVGDGSRGQPERAPFEAIAVHATAPAPPPTLIEQLSVGGRLVVPIATEAADMLTVFRRVADGLGPGGEGLERAVIGPCRFVPLIGSEGFPE